jgi:hypothetical protein
MRIRLLTGGLLLLGAVPAAAQEFSDSLRVFAVEAGTPSVPTLQVLIVAGAVALLVFRQWAGVRNGAGILKF